MLEKRQLVKEGKLSQQELTAAEDEAIIAAVKMQTDVGIKAITDGEIRRYVSPCVCDSVYLADETAVAEPCSTMACSITWME